MHATANKQQLSWVSMGRLLVIWRELDWYFDDKHGPHREFLQKQAQEKVPALLELIKPDSQEPDEGTWLVDLADLLLGWMEGGRGGLQLLLLSGLEQDGRSKAVSRLHAFLTRRVQSRLAARYTDEIECALAAQCFIELIFHFGLTHTLEGKWASGVPRQQIVQMIVRMVLGHSAPGTLSQDPQSQVRGGRSRRPGQAASRFGKGRSARGRLPNRFQSRSLKVLPPAWREP